MADTSLMRTPLKSVRRLGSAKGGTQKFWTQRVTAVATLVLSIFAVLLLVTLAGREPDVVRRSLSNPMVALPLLLLVVAGVLHMRLGMQVIIEDYVPAEGKKVVLLMLNTFFSFAIGAACTFALLKISFVGA